MNAAHGIPMAKEKIKPDEDDLDEEAYAALLAIFENFINGIGDKITVDELLEQLAGLRAKFGFEAALKGFEIDYDTAIELINSEDAKLTEEQKKRRNVLIAALVNIIDFAVAEEYQMIGSVEDVVGEIEWGMDLEESEMEDAVGVFERYNLTYLSVENGDIEHAMHVALGLYLLSETTMITYRTQLDDRVRPWHFQYEGFSAPKAVFPEWLIPPIEHGCRCFLETDNLFGSINAKTDSAKKTDIPEWFNRTFKESVANGGRIFSDEHPYFYVKDEDVERLQSMSEKIRKEYFDGD